MEPAIFPEPRVLQPPRFRFSRKGMVAPREKFVFDPHSLQVFTDFINITSQSVDSDVRPLGQHCLVEKCFVSLFGEYLLQAFPQWCGRKFLRGVASHPLEPESPDSIESFVLISVLRLTIFTSSSVTRSLPKEAPSFSATCPSALNAPAASARLRLS